MSKAVRTSARYLLKKDAEPVRQGKWYPAEDEAKPRSRKGFKPAASKLRASITPGTVLILLSGRFRGRRVVFLKQLPSGLLLVTGPYAVNGVPLRRVNQAYVIATKTKVNVSGVKVPEDVNDAYFQKAERAAAPRGEEAFFAYSKSAVTTSDASKAKQAAVDAGFKLDDVTKAYLKARFSLTKGQKPHALTF